MQPAESAPESLQSVKEREGAKSTLEKGRGAKRSIYCEREHEQRREASISSCNGQAVSPAGGYQRVAVSKLLALFTQSTAARHSFGLWSMVFLKYVDIWRVSN